MITAIRKLKPIPIEINGSKNSAEENIKEPNKNAEESEDDEKLLNKLPFGNCLDEKPELFYTRPIPTIDLDTFYKNLSENIEVKNPNIDKLNELEDDDYNIWYGNHEVIEIKEQDEDEKWNPPNSLEDIRRGKTDEKTMKKYIKGITEESRKLYFKNIAKNIEESNIQSIIDIILKEYGMEKEKYNVKIMKRGRMRGQGFVETSKIDIAKIIKEELNGYILFNKPIVIEYSKDKSSTNNEI